ncbi:unnamed protein product [Penicillium discolor]
MPTSGSSIPPVLPPSLFIIITTATVFCQLAMPIILIRLKSFQDSDAGMSAPSILVDSFSEKASKTM